MCIIGLGAASKAQNSYEYVRNSFSPIVNIKDHVPRCPLFDVVYLTNISKILWWVLFILNTLPAVFESIPRGEECRRLSSRCCSTGTDSQTKTTTALCYIRGHLRIFQIRKIVYFGLCINNIAIFSVGNEKCLCKVSGVFS